MGGQLSLTGHSAQNPPACASVEAMLSLRAWDPSGTREERESRGKKLLSSGGITDHGNHLQVDLAQNQTSVASLTIRLEMLRNLRAIRKVTTAFVRPQIH